MVRFFARAVLLGVVTAAILLVAMPDLRTKTPAFSLPTSEPELAPQYSFNYAVRRASPAVVNIYSRRYGNNNRLLLNTEGLGSGVIMSDKGYIVTNFHVVEQADQVVVALQDGRIFTAQLLGKDRLTDLAVLKIQADNLPVIPRNDEYNPAVGDVVLAIGNPYNLGQTTTYGIISATGRSGLSAYGRQDFLQTDAAINNGNSGGALVNTRGELVGINTASLQQAYDVDTYGISFAIPYRLTAKIMEKLIADGRVTRGYIGIDGRDVTPVMAHMFDSQQVQGIIVVGMDPNGPANQAGFKVQDILMEINGQAVQGKRNVLDIVTELRPGAVIPMKVLRDGQPLTLEVTIGEIPYEP
ncbi:outer membrane-stress sensor serine endopeptidase DegS [Thaumasiovibrio subtropicus]|uniref:outer membrane-stress sensor serine endopeptidase DegS n=1 Tax=Thaumasiovibrio subtropicus TaxID=1891207 RepID=UPI000B35B72B|nr:outer membrane-stress sensor serine endopeptidase DegS [Thaumasiovibrio subtropicus]